MAPQLTMYLFGFWPKHLVWTYPGEEAIAPLMLKQKVMRRYIQWHLIMLVSFDNGELEEITPLTSNSGKVILKETNQSRRSILSPLHKSKRRRWRLYQYHCYKQWKIPLGICLGQGNCLQQMSQIPLQSRQARVLPEPLK